MTQITLYVSEFVSCGLGDRNPVAFEKMPFEDFITLRVSPGSHDKLRICKGLKGFLEDGLNLLANEDLTVCVCVCVCVCMCVSVYAQA